MHLELLNIGHTSPATVPSNERASCKHSLHTKSCIIWVIIYGVLNLSINSVWQNAMHKKKKSQIWAATTRHGLACVTYRMHLDHQYFTAAWVPWVTNPPRCEKAFISPPLKLFSVRYVVGTPHNCEVVNDHLEPVQENDRAKKRRRREEDGSVDWERARTGREAINTAIRMRRWWRLAWESVSKLLFPRSHVCHKYPIIVCSCCAPANEPLWNVMQLQKVTRGWPNVNQFTQRHTKNTDTQKLSAQNIASGKTPAATWTNLSTGPTLNQFASLETIV